MIKMEAKIDVKAEDLWKILKSECTLPEAMKMLGSSQKAIDESMSQIGTSMSGFNSGSMLCIWIAYHKLVDMGEIDKTRMWNFAAQDYFIFDNARHGDLGMKDFRVHRFSGGKWEQIS